MKTASPLDVHKEDILAYMKAGKTPEEIVKYLSTPTSPRSVRRALKRWGLDTTPEKAGVHIQGDSAEVTDKPDPRAWRDSLNDSDAMLRERGFDPEEWELDDFIINEWDSPTGETMKQLKLFLKRRKPKYMVMPAQIDLKLPPLGEARPKKIGSRLIVLVGDQQAPYHDPELHRQFCDWLHCNKPDEGILLGDTADFPVISRHPDEPDWAASTQECVNAVGQILYEYRVSSDPTRWRKLAGNHDERLRRAVINNLGDFYGLRPAQVEALEELPPIHDPVHLFRLNELGVEFVRARGSYDHAQIKLSPYVAARHGWIARKGSGSSALASLDHLGHSIFVGHTHRQSIVHQTKHDINGQATTTVGVETGCMCRIEEGLGYAVAPDWQQGFATATIFPDGTFHPELATFVDGHLYWRDQRYS